MKVTVAALKTLLLLSVYSQRIVSCHGQKTQEIPTSPYVKARKLIGGKVTEVESSDMELKEVFGCCSHTTKATDSEICETENRLLTPQKIGDMPQMTTEETLDVLEDAKRAWNNGSGEWPQMSLAQRIEAIENFMAELEKERDTIVNTLMWEIGKNMHDARSEYSRTISFIKESIKFIRENYNSDFESYGSTKAFTRRAAVGIVMALGPMNYPLNETYATVIPALLMGNVVIMKIPTVGGLSHLLTMKAFTKALPPGVINLVSGGGRKTMPPLMATGDIDSLAFIGGSKAADDLIRKHPEPHRLKVFLQLEAKNMGIVLRDIFEDNSDTEFLENTVQNLVTGALSFNGQRCTAIKLIFAPFEHAVNLASMVSDLVESLPVGLPWEEHDIEYTRDGVTKTSKAFSQITPLPNKTRVAYMQKLIDDAVSKGAKILNKNGGKIIGGENSTLMVPAVLYPVDTRMDIYHEEQFGPIVPIASYENLNEVLENGQNGKYAQQCAVFTSKVEGNNEATLIVDRFSSVFGKININSQCGRSPDALAFSGRRSSAMGVMSIEDALREFSIPTVIAYKSDSISSKVAEGIKSNSNFMKSL